MNLCNCFFASISWLYSKLLDKMNKINKQKFVWKGPLSLETFPAGKISSTSRSDQRYFPRGFFFYTFIFKESYLGDRDHPKQLKVI